MKVSLYKSSALESAVFDCSSSRSILLLILTLCFFFTPLTGFAQGELRIIGHTNPIQVYIEVVTNDGNPIGGLASDAFQVNENGTSVTQSVTAVTSSTDIAKTLVFVMDYSSSMSSSFSFMESAVLNAINLLEADDQAAIIKFNGQKGVSVVQAITSDKTLLNTAVQTSYLGSGTNLYEAISVALGILSGQTGSKALIVLTDGRDNESDISLANLTGELNNASVPVFTIGLGSLIDNTLLQSIAEATGATNSLVTDPTELTTVYEEISDRLKNEYLLTYNSAITACGPQTLEVVVNTSEGDKTYTGTFERCFPQVLEETPVSKKRRSGGGSFHAWEIAILLLALTLSYALSRRTSSTYARQYRFLTAIKSRT